MELLALASIAGWAFYIQKMNPNFKGFSAFLTISLAIAFLFLSAFFGVLKVGTILMLVSGVGLFGYFVFEVIRLVISVFNKNENKNRSSVAETLTFFGLSVAWFFWTKDSFVFGWDEFFWGQFTKAIVYESKFYDSTGPILISHYRYPPGLPLWQYFFTSLGEFKENALLFANGLFTMAAFTALISYERKAIISNFLKIWAFLYILAAFASGLSSMLADYLIGICLGLTLVLLFRIKTLRDVIWFIPLIWFFSLIKQTGLVLSGLLAVGAIIMSFQQVSFSKKYIKPLFFMFVLLQAAVPHLLWKRYLSTTPVYITLFNPESILNGDTLGKILENTPLSLAIISKFLRDLSGSNLLYAQGTPLRTYGFTSLCTLFVLLFCLSKWSNPEILPRKYRYYFSALFLLGSAWLSVHLLSYLMIFPDKEGIQMASLERYLSTFVIGFGVLVTYFFGEALKSVSSDKKRKWAIFVAGIFIFSIPWLQPINTGLLTKKLEEGDVALRTLAVRNMLEKTVEIIGNNTPKNARIWFVFQNSNGQEAMIMRYLASPRRISSYGWSWGNPYGPGDLWTSNVSHQEIRKMMMTHKAEFLMVAKADEGFWNRYKDLFDPDSKFTDNTLFEVSSDPESKYLFRNLRKN